jgi:uncharacterized membrane protein YozB (DUF420 family)
MAAVSSLLQGAGVLGTKAPFGTKASLIAMVLAAVLFTIGWRLAVHKRFEAHRWVQTAAVCLNAVPVLAWMIRFFVLYVVPEIPARLGQRSYAVTTVHALVGVVGLTLGVFVDLRGNELVPARLRFSNYKLFMRSSYALYMLATLTGVIVYVVAYGSGLK